jgi:serine/threonine protein kinase
MAEVWEARHVHLGTRAAVKFLLPEYAADQGLQLRFLNEGRRQAELQHPNILPATDFFLANGRSYLVLPYIDGQSLEKRLRKENPPLSIEEVHAISWGVLSALEYAHSRQVIHRDVKPDNVLLDRDGRVLLMDFGIAKALTEDSSITLTNTSMGTPAYMSPEQILRPKQVSSHSDIYSFGCLLYAMLSGSPPFGSEDSTPFYVQDCHVRSAPPPLVCRVVGISTAAAESVVRKCLEKDPENRFPNCDAVMTALEGAISGEMPAGPATVVETAAKRTQPLPPPVVSHGSRYVFAGVIAIILLSSIGYLWVRHNQRRTDLMNTDWSHIQAGDPKLSDCMDVQSCLERKQRADNLAAAEWKAIRYDSSLFSDCMGVEPCIERSQQAQRLMAVKDWNGLQDKQLLTDCMGYQPCLKEVASRAIARPRLSAATNESNCETEMNYESCDSAPNPAVCRKCRDQEGLSRGSIYSHK